MWAMLFLLLGIFLKDNDNKIIHELSLICIAISAGFKIYPAIFGMIYIVEKRWKEAARLVLYGVFFFFSPFIFWSDRVNIVDYIGTFERYLGKEVYSQTSILGNCIMVFGENGALLGKAIVIALIIWALFYLFTEKVNWKSLVILTATNTIILAESYLYTYVFITIPLIAFLNQKKENYEKMDFVYATLFAFIFTLPPYSLDVEGAIFRGIYMSWIALIALVSLEKLLKIARNVKNS